MVRWKSVGRRKARRRRTSQAGTNTEFKWTYSTESTSEVGGIAVFRRQLRRKSEWVVEIGNAMRFWNKYRVILPSLVNNPTRTLVCVVYHLYLLCSLGNLTAASLLARDGGACAARPGLVAEKGEPPTYLSSTNFTTILGTGIASPSFKAMGLCQTYPLRGRKAARQLIYRFWTSPGKAKR